MDQEQFEQFLKMQQSMITTLVTQLVKKSNEESNFQTAETPSTSNIALIPNFEYFDSKKESFSNYKQRFENYAQLKNIISNKDYCGKLLLNSIGASNFNVLVALAAPKQPNELSYDELMKLLEEHLAPKKNVLVAQHQFLSLYQTEQESITEFVSKLKSNIADCEFISSCACKTSIADTFLRAQFIRGLKDNTVREQLLLSNVSEFKEIVSKAVALESSRIDSKIISQSSLPTSINVNKVSSGKTTKHSQCESKVKSNFVRHGFSSSNPKSKHKSTINYAHLGLNGICLRCGKDNHIAKDCRTERSKLKCSGCLKSGHVKKVCIRSLLNDKSKPSQDSTNQVQDDLSTHQYGVNQVVDIYQLKQPNVNERYQTYIDIEGRPVKFEIDTGSGYTFLPRDQFSKLNLNVPLMPSNLSFRSYTQDVFTPDGRVDVNASYNGTTIQGEIYIVPENYPPIVGRAWIRQLKISLDEINDQHFDRSQSNEINALSDVDEIISMFPTIFEEKIGCVSNFRVSLGLREGTKPIFTREREVPFALIDKVEQELDSLESAGIISQADTSDWGSPLVIIPKADGSVRLCVDYKVGVNERLVNFHYPIKKVDNILSSLRNSKYFCRLDLYKAYLHVPVDEKSSEIQTITTHRGTYRMNRLSFGIKTAPAEFNRIIDQILQNVPKTEYYFDDIVVHGATMEECKSNLILCLNQLQKNDLHLNLKKCSFFKERIEFLGHVVEQNKISKSPDKVKAITDMDAPKSVEEVRRFLGMVTYYNRFIPNASTLTYPLRQLLKKNSVFKWTNKCDIAFKRLKKEISSDQILIPYDPALPVQLACDASPYGIAGILSHNVKGEERPIAFASRSLTPAEQNYSQLDREALAIVFSVDHFYQYLFARPFKLITDNQPLVRIFHQHAKLPKMTSARLQRYAAFLSGFNYEVVYKKGSENSNVDCLSRSPVESKPLTDSHINQEVFQIHENSISCIMNTKLTHESLREETLKDENLSKIIKDLQTSRNENTEFTVDHDILFRGTRVVIPTSLQHSVLQELHHTHIGMTKMKQLARRYVYWKSIDKDIEQIVRSCSTCATTRNSPPKSPLHPWEEPDSNWQRIHVDYAGPYQGHYFLVIIDAKSKWLEVEMSSSAPTSLSTIDLLQNVFSRNGFPEVMVSDNAAIFTSETFQNFCKEGGIFQKFIAPGHPATNGLAERNVQTVKHRIASMVNETGLMRQKIREILFRYRATPLASGKTPSELYLNRQIRIKLDALKPTKLVKSSSPPVKKTRQLAEGDQVQAHYYTNNKTFWKQGKVVKKLGRLHYMVRLENGYVFKRHINQLRKSELHQKLCEGQNSQPPGQQQDNNLQRFCMEDVVSFQPSANNQDGTRDEGTPERHEATEEQVLRRSNRTHRLPHYLHDYVTS